MKSVICALFLLPVCAAEGQVFDEQPWDGVTGGRLATAYTDAPSLSTYQFDTFDMPVFDAIESVYIYGTDAGHSSSDVYHLRICSMPSFVNPGTVYVDISRTVFVYEQGNLNFRGLNEQLGAGRYYLSAWVTRPSANGSWLWRATTPVRNGEAIYHNPGGGQGFGTNPIPGSAVYGQQRDMAYIIYGGNLPEPASITAVALGLPLMRRWMKKQVRAG